MKFIAKYVIGIILVVLSAFIFKVDDSVVHSQTLSSTDSQETVFTFASISSHADAVMPENTITLTNNARRVAPNQLPYRPYFTKEQNDFTIYQPICRYSTNLSTINKPQSYYYIYTLLKIRI